MTQPAQKSQPINSRGLAVGLFLFGGLMLAAGLPLRIYQQLHLIDENGFWAYNSAGNQSAAMQVVLYVIIAVLALGPSVYALLARNSRRQAMLDLGRRRRTSEGIACLVAAFTLVVDAVAAIGFAAALTQDISSGTAQEMARATAGQMIVRSGAAAAILEAVFGLGGAAFFINLAMTDWFPKKKIYLNRLLALAPLFWCVCRILRRSARTISYLRVSDLFLNQCMLALLMLFFLAFAQLLSGINNERRVPRLFAMGLPAAALALLCFVPRVAAALAGVPLSQDAAIELCDPALAAFIVVFFAGRLLLAEASEDEEEQEDMSDDGEKEQVEISKDANELQCSE